VPKAVSILHDQYYINSFYANPDTPATMSDLPEALRIPDGPECLSLPPNNLPVASIIKFQLPPQHKSTVYMDPSDYF
jgi:hypothetical protein